MELYRKNKNLFNFSEEKPSKKHQAITSKIGSQLSTNNYTAEQLSKLKVSK